MFGRKGLVIGGSTLIVAIIGGTLLINNNSTPTITEASLLEQYQQLQKDGRQQVAQDCDDPQAFSKQAKDLEDRFDKLRQQKHDLIAEANTEERIPDLPPIPGSEAPTDIGPYDASDPAEANTDERIPDLPPIPGSEAPTDIGPYDASDPAGETERIPDLPPIPGSEAPTDIGPYDASDPAEANTDERIPDLPPIPGSEAPTDIGPYDASDPAEANTDERIPDLPPIPGSEPFDLSEGEITPMQQIHNIEVDMKDILDALKSKCDGTTKACEGACNNYNNKCLSLVPNRNQKMLDDGFSSCMDLCKTRNKEKITCMANAPDCVSMTEVCGL